MRPPSDTGTCPSVSDFLRDRACSDSGSCSHRRSWCASTCACKSSRSKASRASTRLSKSDYKRVKNKSHRASSSRTTRAGWSERPAGGARCSLSAPCGGLPRASTLRTRRTSFACSVSTRAQSCAGQRLSACERVSYDVHAGWGRHPPVAGEDNRCACTPESGRDPNQSGRGVHAQRNGGEAGDGRGSTVRYVTSPTPSGDGTGFNLPPCPPSAREC